MWELTIVGENNSSIRFECTEIKQDYPSFELNISVDSDGFHGEVSAVWCFASDLQEFLDNLHDTDKLHQGKAQLISMSDQSDFNPFRFKIFSVEFMTVTLDLQVMKYLSTAVVTHKLSVTFEIDPSDLPKMVEGFQELLKEFN